MDDKTQHEFETKIKELNKQEEQLKAEKSKAEERKRIAGKQSERDRAVMEGKDSTSIIAGITKEIVVIDQKLQRLKDEKINLFSAYGASLKVKCNTVRQKAHREIIAPINRMVANFEKTASESIEVFSSGHSQSEEVLTEMERWEAAIVSFNVLAKENRVPGNLLIPVDDRPSHVFYAEAQKCFVDAKRKFDTIVKRITAAIEGKVSALRNKPS